MAQKPKESNVFESSYQTAYIASIGLKGFKCFIKPIFLEFSNENEAPASWTVILGDNGTGKTTLLQSIIFLKPTIETIPHDEDDEALILPYLWSSEEFKQFSIDGLVDPGGFFGINFYKANSLTSAKLISRNLDETEKLNHHSAESQYFLYVKGVEGDEKLGNGQSGNTAYLEDYYYLLNIITIGYGVSRNKGEVVFSQVKVGGKNDYANLFGGRDTLINPEEWLLTLQLQIKNSSADLKKLLLAKEKLVKDTLTSLLPDVSDIRGKKVKKQQDKPGIEVQTPYGWIDIKSLSHGYQTVTAWIVDLAARLFYHYPDSQNPLAEPAVVLVDEIDLHLHPKWQRTIMQDLSRHFPNVQFIVTAHSPLIVQSAPEGTNVVVLKRVGDHVEIINDPVSVRGWRVDQILASELFDISSRGPEYDDVLKRRNVLIHKPKLTKKEETELKEISEKLGKELRYDRDPQVSALLEEAAKYQKGKK